MRFNLRLGISRMFFDDCRWMMRVLSVALLTLLMAANSRADVVELSGHRTLRVFGIAIARGEATLSLAGGGNITLPVTSIEAIEIEPVSVDLCAAAPFRCQDRARLLMRQPNPAAATAAPVVATHTVQP